MFSLALTTNTHAHTHTQRARNRRDRKKSLTNICFVKKKKEKRNVLSIDHLRFLLQIEEEESKTFSSKIIFILTSIKIKLFKNIVLARLGLLAAFVILIYLPSSGPFHLVLEGPGLEPTTKWS